MLNQKNIFSQLSEGCDKECRFNVGISTVSAAYYPPVYDKNGINVNPSRNTSTTKYNCQVCGKHWDIITSVDETNIKLLSE
jgi:hypothetical protein